MDTCCTKAYRRLANLQPNNCSWVVKACTDFMYADVSVWQQSDVACFVASWLDNISREIIPNNWNPMLNFGLALYLGRRRPVPRGWTNTDNLVIACTWVAVLMMAGKQEGYLTEWLLHRHLFSNPFSLTTPNTSNNKVRNHLFHIQLRKRSLLWRFDRNALVIEKMRPVFYVCAFWPLFLLAFSLWIRFRHWCEWMRQSNYFWALVCLDRRRYWKS